jgi:hypothetical protein
MKADRLLDMFLFVTDRLRLALLTVLALAALKLFAAPPAQAGAPVAPVVTIHLPR